MKERVPQHHVWELDMINNSINANKLNDALNELYILLPFLIDEKTIHTDFS